MFPCSTCFGYFHPHRWNYRWKLFVGTSLAVQWLRLCFPKQQVGVWSLIRELRSYKPHSQNTKKTQNRSNIITNSIKILKVLHNKKFYKKNMCKGKLHLFYFYVTTQDVNTCKRNRTNNLKNCSGNCSITLINPTDSFHCNIVIFNVTEDAGWMDRLIRCW